VRHAEIAGGSGHGLSQREGICGLKFSYAVGEQPEQLQRLSTNDSFAYCIEDELGGIVQVQLL
jgi:hypothetical protein